MSNQADGFSPGDRVCGFHWYGGMAERAVVLEQNLASLPELVSSHVGAAIPGTYGTSYHALIDRAGVEAAETLLVLGATGGVGFAAVHIAKIVGATVIQPFHRT